MPDLDSRNALVERHLPLANRLALECWRKRGRPYDVERDDLQSHAYLSLLRAAELYAGAPGDDGAFTAYAATFIRRDLGHYFRDEHALIREPAWIHEARSAALRAGESYPVALESVPIDAPATLHSESDATLADCIADDARLSAQERTECALFVRQAWHLLSPREQKTVALFYGQELTKSEIGKRLGLSNWTANYILQGALATLKAALELPSASDNSMARAAAAELLRQSAPPGPTNRARRKSQRCPSPTGGKRQTTKPVRCLAP